MSKRNSSRARQPVNEVGSVQGDDTPNSNTVVSTKKRNVKRARGNVSAPENTSKKEQGVDRGSSHSLINIPVEIFMQIASFISPADLLSIARTCKTLRGTLLKSSAIPIWRVAEDSVLGLPNCPEDMHPPDYAVLAFTKVCTSCGDLTINKADPFLRVRLCKICRIIKLEGASFYDKEPYPELELVSTTKLIKDQLVNLTMGHVICLAQEAEDVRRRLGELAAAEDPEALKQWRIEQHGLVESRRQFGENLLQFLSSVTKTRQGELNEIKNQRREAVEERLRGLGWTDKDWQFTWMPTYEKWFALVENPKPLTDRIWNNLYPKLLAFLEPNRARRLQYEKQDRSQARWKRVRTLLQDLKPRINPFHSVLGKLGFDPSLPVDPSKVGSSYLNSLADYPFPNDATFIKWSCFADIETLDPSMDELETLFNERRQDIENEIEGWRHQAEQELIKWRSSTGLGPSNGSASDVFKDNGVVNESGDLPSNIEFLLRADAVFSILPPESSNGQIQPYYYPQLVPKTAGYSLYQQEERKIRYYRHEEAEKITKAILDSVGLQDATYYEAIVRGPVFSCERCEDKKAKTWDEVLAHYMQANKVLTKILQRDPRIKAKYATAPRDVHSLQAGNPFVRLLDGDEPLSAHEPSALDLPQTLVCLPCKNNRRVYTVKVLDDMATHLHNAHGVGKLCERVTHQPSGMDDPFSDLNEGGLLGQWRRSWDRFAPKHLVAG